jgi:hypothetical protein
MRPAQRLVGNVVSPSPVTSISKSAALPGFFCAGAASPPPISARKFLELLPCRRFTADFEFLHGLPEGPWDGDRESGHRTLGCRTCDPEEVLPDPQVVVPHACDTDGGRSRAGLGGKVAVALCVTVRLSAE